MSFGPRKLQRIRRERDNTVRVMMCVTKLQYAILHNKIPPRLMHSRYYVALLFAGWHLKGINYHGALRCDSLVKK